MVANMDMSMEMFQENKSLREEVKTLKAQLKATEVKLPYPCPTCGRGRSFMSTINGGEFSHDCLIDGKEVYDLREPKNLKTGQKALLHNGVGQ